jgi:hypothetical protein
MGIHSGPVNEVADLNEQANIAGAGINIAQRVMDCGDAGHILLSKHVAEDLEHYARWQPYLHDLGLVEVKHGIRLGIVNYSDGIGNSQMPEKLVSALHESARPRTKRKLITTIAIIVLLATALSLRFFSRGRNTLTPHSVRRPQSVTKASLCCPLPMSAGQGSGIFLRWDQRRNSRCAREGGRIARCRAHFVIFVQRKECRCG